MNVYQKNWRVSFAHSFHTLHYWQVDGKCLLMWTSELVNTVHLFFIFNTAKMMGKRRLSWHSVRYRIIRFWFITLKLAGKNNAVTLPINPITKKRKKKKIVSTNSSSGHILNDIWCAISVFCSFCYALGVWDIFLFH